MIQQQLTQPDNFVDTETTICNTNVVPVDQKMLTTTCTCPDCSNEVRLRIFSGLFMQTNVCKIFLFCR